MNAIVSVRNLSKTYSSGFQALDDVSLDIHRGEIFALLGPNGAGKTTLISIICGLVNASSGSVLIDGFDHQSEYRQVRAMVGLVPQELLTNAFESVYDEVCYSRGLFGMRPNANHIESILKSLTLWDKRRTKVMELSGGMKRRLLIAKALSHEPKVLFLDEPTAGVDVELRQNMWKLIDELKKNGTTIILTTHYLAEAEAIADRVGIVDHGKLLMVEEKKKLIDTLGKKSLIIEISQPIDAIPESLIKFTVTLDGPQTIRYEYDTQHQNDIPRLLNELQNEGIVVVDLSTEQSSLENIFLDLISKQP